MPYQFHLILPQRLRELDINIIEEGPSGQAKDYTQIGGGDVVIFPAFGATVGELKEFRDKGVQMVDTTCPWVAKVWGNCLSERPFEEFWAHAFVLF